MAIQLVGLSHRSPEFANPTFVNPAVNAIVNDQSLEKIIKNRQLLTDGGQLPLEHAQSLSQIGNKVRAAYKNTPGGFREVVVYVGITRNNSNSVGAVSFVGKEGNVPVPYAGRTDTILTDLSDEADILIVHTHPGTANASDEDLNVLSHLNQDLRIGFSSSHMASMLIIGDTQEILHTFDQQGRYKKINIEEVLLKEKLTQTQLEKLYLLINKNKIYGANNPYAPLVDNGDLWPVEIPYKGLLFPGQFGVKPSASILPPDTELQDSSLSIVRNNPHESTLVPVVFIEKDGISRPVQIQNTQDNNYAIVLNGFPYFSDLHNLFPISTPKIVFPPERIIKLGDYTINLTGNKKPIDILAVPIDLIPDKLQKSILA